jgi:three-Cys-motif partner protein
VNTSGAFEDDGLYMPEVGPWSDVKYRLISNYAEMFSTSMRKKWDKRVYIDLFAGAGRATIKDTKEIVLTSSLLAMGVTHPFDRYVLCDSDAQCVDALRTRVADHYPNHDVVYLAGDCNDTVDEVLERVPRFSKNCRVLSFCVVDPYNVSNLKFETIKKLSQIYADFLVLIPSHMDANREQTTYLDPKSTSISDFVGRPHWRDDHRGYRRQFGTFVVDQFGQSMKDLGFIYEGPGAEVLVKLPKKNVKLYYLAFFSKSKLGMKFWNEAQKYSDDQMGFF